MLSAIWDKIRGWKTIIVGSSATIAALATELGAFHWDSLFGPKTVAILGIAMIVLRIITTGPVGTK